jgi:hypothetical protein
MSTREDSVNAQYEKQRQAMIRAKEKYDREMEKLEAIRQKRDAIRNRKLLDCIAKSSRSYEEIVAFLNGEGNQEDV